MLQRFLNPTVLAGISGWTWWPHCGRRVVAGLHRSPISASARSLPNTSSASHRPGDVTAQRRIRQLLAEAEIGAAMQTGHEPVDHSAGHKSRPEIPARTVGFRKTLSMAGKPRLFSRRGMASNSLLKGRPASNGRTGLEVQQNTMTQNRLQMRRVMSS